MDYEKLGQTQLVTFDNGVTCLIYIPENINPNTDVFCYTHGGNTSGAGVYHADWKAGQAYLEQFGSDSIVIMPTMPNRWDEEWGSKTINIVEMLQEHYGITNDNVTSAGFSWGGWGSAEITVENITRNPDAEPQILYLLDDYGNPSEGWKHLALYSDDGTKEALLENESIVFTFHNSGINLNQVGDKSTQINNIAESGINTVRVICEYGGHIEINNRFFANGFIDYRSGRVNLPQDDTLEINGKTYTGKYTYQIYNKKTGLWETVSASEINTIDKLYEYFDINTYDNKITTLQSINNVDIYSLSVTSDSSVLEGQINNILGAIKGSSFVQNSINFEMGCSSTTKIPTAISTVVKSFFQANADFLIKLSNDMTAISQIGASIDEINRYLERNAQELGVQSDAATETLPPTTMTPQTTGSSEQEVPLSGEETSQSPSLDTTEYTTTDNREKTNSNQTDEFPKYENIYSDENRIVYADDDECKIVVHTDGDKVIGIEHYYDFGSTSNANAALKNLVNHYSGNKNFENIVQNDRYIKVVFSEDMYKNISASEIKDKLSNLNEIVKL